MHDLRLTLLQAPIFWEQPDRNRKIYAAMLKTYGMPTDLVVLPEMFTTGFTMDPAPHAEPMDGPSMQWMARHAAAHDAAVVGSLIIKEGGNYFNRLIFMRPDGSYETYDKRHRFAMAGEHERYAAGSERLVVDYRGWRICPLICYDLRFPVWSRNRDEFDLLIYVANWPDRRAYDWNTLLRARAIENQCYVVGVNRTGTDANGHTYAGDSCVIDPGWRRTLFDAGDREVVHTLKLSGSHLRKVRKSLPFLADRDDFTLRP